MANFSGLAIVAGTPRTIVIDGCNVGFHHGKHKFLSLRGVNICAEYFTKRGHEVKVFLSHAAYYKADTETKAEMDIMKESGLLAFGHKSSYDDLSIIKYAALKRGIVVSNDRFRDVLEQYE